MNLNTLSQDSLSTVSAVDFAAVLQAYERIRRYAHRTPVVTCLKLDRISGHELFFKCENLQKAGAFKFRGACNAIAQLDAAQLARGVVTHSSGNHAGALALAAQMFGTKAYVVMPENSIAVKRAAVLEYGGVVIPCANTQADREATAARVQAETGATLISPYDDPRIIAGQGTATLELLQEVPDLEIVIAPVGGGGLLAGTSLAAKGINPGIAVLAAEPSLADDAYQSLQRGERVLLPTSKTVADGLRTNLGEWTWPIIRDHVREIIRIDEAEIKATTRLFWERTKLLIEPSSAVAVAAALYHLTGEKSGRRIGVILSGGNVDFSSMAW